MYGLAVNLIVSVSGHPWIIHEMNSQLKNFAILHIFHFLALK